MKKRQQAGGAHSRSEECEYLTVTSVNHQKNAPISTSKLHEKIIKKHEADMVCEIMAVCVCICPVCALCRLSDDDPAVFGEKVVLREHGFSIHYFCLVSFCLYPGENRYQL